MQDGSSHLLTVLGYPSTPAHPTPLAATLRLLKIPSARWLRHCSHQACTPRLDPPHRVPWYRLCARGPRSSWCQTMLVLIWASRSGLAALAVQSPAGAGVAGLPCRGGLPLCTNKQISIQGTSEGLLLLPCLLTVFVMKDVCT